MEFFNKLNANERLAAIGAVIVILASIVGLVTSFGLGASIIALLAAIAVLVIYYLKYSPSQSINWPAPVPLLVLGISGVAALLAIIGTLPLLGLLGFFGLGVLAGIGTVVGSLIMAWGAWQEYQAMPKAATSTSASGATTARASAPTTATGSGTPATGPTATDPSTTATGPTSSTTYADPPSTPPSNPPYSDPNP